MTYELYWAIVTVFTFLILFLPAEIMAYRDDQQGGTLSETVWKIIYPPKHTRLHRYRRWIRIGFIGALGWLVVHLVSGGFI